MEGEAGAGEEPGFPVAGQALDAGGLGGRQLDRGDTGRAWLAAPDWHWRAVGIEAQVSGAGSGLAAGRGGVLADGGHGGREGGGTGEGGADSGGPELGEGGQGGVP